MNSIRLLGAVLLCIAWLAVLLAVVVPTASLFLGLGIDVPHSWARSGKLHLVYAYPWFSLFLGLMILVVIGWAAWRLWSG